MESFGEKLRNARENANYSIEQIARDTHISKRYLRALEAEDFSVFPGETYLKGFLKNYAEYLGLNPEEMVNIYKNIMIQEQPIPLDQLLEKKKSGLPVPLIISGAGVFVVIVVFLLILINPFYSENNPQTTRSEPEEKETTLVSSGNEYIFKDYVKSFTVSAPGTISVVTAIDNKKYKIFIEDIDSTLILASGIEKFEMIIGEEKLLDLDNDDHFDINIELYDIDAKADPKEAKIELKRITRQAKVSDQDKTEEEEEVLEEQEEEKTEAETITGEEKIASINDQEDIDRGDEEIPHIVAASSENVIVLLEEEKPKPFTIDTIFTRYCLFIYYIDDQPRVQKYFHKGETHPLSAVNQAELRFSDGGAVNLKVAGFNINLGGIGQVGGRSIKWMQDEESGKYQLIVTPIR